MNSVKIQDIANIRTGYSFRGKVNDTQSGISVLRPADLSNTTWQGVLPQVSSQLLGNSAGRHLLRPGDLVQVNKGTALVNAVYEGSPHKVVVTSSFFVITPNASLLNSHYLSWCLTQRQVNEQMQSYLSKTTVPSLSIAMMRKVEIPLPPLKVQVEIARLQDLVKEEKRELLALINKRHQYANAKSWEILNQSL